MHFRTLHIAKIDFDFQNCRNCGDTQAAIRRPWHIVVVISDHSVSERGEWMHSLADSTDFHFFFKKIFYFEKAVQRSTAVQEFKKAVKQVEKQYCTALAVRFPHPGYACTAKIATGERIVGDTTQCATQ